MESKTLLEYKGAIDQSVADSILTGAKSVLKTVDAKPQAKKKTYNLLVECVENILKYAASGTGFQEHEPSVRVLLNNDYLKIISGNIVDNTCIPAVRNKIEKVNSLDKEQLSGYYSSVIDNPDVSEKGGAGLGFIDMVIRSGNKIEFSFSPVSTGFSFFEIILTVNLNM